MINILFLLLFSVNAHALTNSTAAIGQNFESNIMIVTNGPDGKGGSTSSYCNATLITSQVMVTAAHCVKDAFALNDTNIKVHIGLYKYVVNLAGNFVRVGYVDYIQETFKAAYFFTPKVKQEILIRGVKANVTPSDDTAVVILKEPLILKEDFRYAEIVSRAELALFTNSVSKMYPTVVTINPMEEVTTSDTKKMAVLNHVNNKSGYFISKSSSRVKSGDSGAPLFVSAGNKWKLLATVKGEMHNMLSSQDLYTQVLPNLCVISETIGNSDLGKKLCP